MATKKQRGDFINVVAPTGGYTVGDVIVIGTMVGVVQETVDAGELVGVEVTGVYEITKQATTDTYSQGDEVYVDDSSGEAYTADATGRSYAGLAWEDSANGDTGVEVGLNVQSPSAT